MRKQKMLKVSKILKIVKTRLKKTLKLLVRIYYSFFNTKN